MKRDYVFEALSAACVITGEERSRVAAGAPISNARWYALAALYDSFPEIGIRVTAARCGVPSTSELRSKRLVEEYRQKRWWDETAVQRVKIAIGRAPPPKEAPPVAEEKKRPQKQTVVFIQRRKVVVRPRQETPSPRPSDEVEDLGFLLSRRKNPTRSKTDITDQVLGPDRWK